jgi:hypothetical protein
MHQAANGVEGVQTGSRQAAGAQNAPSPMAFSGRRCAIVPAVFSSEGTQ